MSLIALYLLAQILGGVSAWLCCDVLKYLIQAFFEQSPTEHPLELIVANLSLFSRIIKLELETLDDKFDSRFFLSEQTLVNEEIGHCSVLDLHSV